MAVPFDLKKHFSLALFEFRRRRHFRNESRSGAFFHFSHKKFEIGLKIDGTVFSEISEALSINKFLIYLWQVLTDLEPDINSISRNIRISEVETETPPQPDNAELNTAIFELYFVVQEFAG